MIDSVRLAFAALTATGVVPPSGTLETAPIDGVPGVWVAIDNSWNEHLVLEIANGDDLPNPIDAVDISSRHLSVAGSVRRLMDVVCRVRALTDVFEHFAAAVIERHTQDPSSPSAAVSTVLDTWRRFLHVSAGVQLGKDALAGLFGELLVLLDLTRADPTAGIAAWAGPDRARHDFRTGDTGLEVKTTLATTAAVVAVHGLDQLDTPTGGTLHLHFVRLELVAGAGESVADLIEAILDAGAPPVSLYDRLDAFGLPVDQIDATSNVTFVVRDRATMRVVDDFPRLVPASLVVGQPMPGVTDVSYRIDLAHSLPGRLAEARYADLLATIAAGVA